MAALLEKIWSASLYGGVIIGVILLLRLVLKGGPRKYICLLWLLAAVRLLVPFELESSFSLQPDMGEVRIPGAARLEMVRSSFDSRAEPLELPTETQPDTQPEQSALWVSSPTVIEREVPLSALILENYEEILAWVWLCVALGLVLYSIVSYWRLKRSVRGAVILSEGVWLCPEQNTAFVLGFLRPQIYLPAGLTEQERRLVLLHERAHISRGDFWWKLLGFGVLALHWFNPLVWVAYLCLCKDLEMACDERVVRSMDVAERKAYSLALLSCSANRRSIAACPVAFGEVSVKARIKNVLNYRKPLFWVTLAAVIAIIFVAVCFLTSPKDVTQTPDPDALTEVSNEWGVSLHASNATATGLKLVCIQSGTDVGGTLGTGSYFWLEQWTDSGWVSVEEIPPEEGVERAWTSEMWLISQGRTLWDVNWSYLYGELSPGTYRLGKVISLTSDETESQPSKTQEIKMYVQFIVGDMAESSLTREEALDMCIAAYEELQGADSYRVTLTSADESITYHYIAGEDYFIDSTVQVGYATLMYQGKLFFLVEPTYMENREIPYGWMSDSWAKAHYPAVFNGEREQFFWENTDWESLSLELRPWEQREDGITLTFTEEGDYDRVWTFTLDEKGKLTHITFTPDRIQTTKWTFVGIDQAYIADQIRERYAEAYRKTPDAVIVRDQAFYEELFTRKADGAYATMWKSHLFEALYAQPEEFTRQLSRKYREDPELVQSVLTSMSYEVQWYEPERFVQVLEQLRKVEDLDQTILDLMAAYLQGE